MTRSSEPPYETTDLLDRVFGHLDWTLRSLADEMRPIGPGWIVRTSSLPLVWTLNQLRITEPITLADAVTLAEEHQADLPYRHVVVVDGTTDPSLEDAFGAAGWNVDREVVMALVETSHREVDTRSVIELSEAQMLALMGGWMTEEQPERANGLDQVEEYNRREGGLWNERCFGILDEEGAPAAISKLRVDGTTAWVEDVYTVPEARGRGYARTLVTYAAGLTRSAEHDLTFIIADDNDWPKNLYAEIGFRPLGTTQTFHLDLSVGGRLS
jgi:GNAT superfamily N-acetyltransferase